MDDDGCLRDVFWWEGWFVEEDYEAIDESYFRFYLARFMRPFIFNFEFIANLYGFMF